MIFTATEMQSLELYFSVKSKREAGKFVSRTDISKIHLSDYTLLTHVIYMHVCYGRNASPFQIEHHPQHDNVMYSRNMLLYIHVYNLYIRYIHICSNDRLGVYWFYSRPTRLIVSVSSNAVVQFSAC